MAAMWSILLSLAWAGEPSAEAMEAVVLVLQGSSMCSGALIDDRGTVATAYHCVASGGRPKVTTRGGQVALGRVRAVDRALDLAVIDVPGLAGQPWLSVRPDEPELGDVVSALGHPFGVTAPAGFLEGTLRWSMTRGVVSAIGSHAIQFSAPINPGNSGGPVVDESGAIVAIVSRRTGGSEGLGFGARADQLQALIERPETGLAGVGGTWGLQPVISAFQSDSGSVSAGGRLVLAARDRVVLGLTVRGGITPRLSAIEYGDVRFAGPAARLGLRQRFGRGRLALRVDAYGEATSVVGFEGTVGGGDVQIRPMPTVWTPLVGGQAEWAGVALDFGCSPLGEGCVASLLLDWPGVVGVF